MAEHIIIPETSTQGPPGNMTIGEPVAGGDPNLLLYCNALGNLSQSSNLYYHEDTGSFGASRTTGGSPATTFNLGLVDIDDTAAAVLTADNLAIDLGGIVGIIDGTTLGSEPVLAVMQVATSTDTASIFVTSGGVTISVDNTVDTTGILILSNTLRFQFGDGIAYDFPVDGGSAGQFLQTDGSGQLLWADAGAVAGTDTMVQFNDGGNMGAVSTFKYNKTTHDMTLGRVLITGDNTLESMRTIWLGQGAATASPTGVSVFATSATDTDQEGGNLVFAPGQSTGTASARMELYVPLASLSSSDTPNNYSTFLYADGVNQAVELNLGDVNQDVNGTRINLSDIQESIRLYANDFVRVSTASGDSVLALNMETIDVSIGDLDNIAHSGYMRIGNDFIWAVTDGNLAIKNTNGYETAVFETFTQLSPFESAIRVRLGDVNQIGYGTRLILTDSGNKVEVLQGRFQTSMASNPVERHPSINTAIELQYNGNMQRVIDAIDIRSINAVTWNASSELILWFTSVLTIFHADPDASGYAGIMLDGGNDLVTADGLILTLLWDGNNWREKCRSFT